MNPLVSIIIPTFNRTHLISDTLDSIFSANLYQLGVYIVDEGSTDKTDYIIQEYLDKDSRFQYHRRPLDKLKGPNSCTDYGVENAKSNYMIFLDSDDLLSKTFFKRKSILGRLENIIYYEIGYTNLVRKRLKPLILDYVKGVENFNVHFLHKKYIPRVFPNWDNSARSGKKMIDV